MLSEHGTYYILVKPDGNPFKSGGSNKVAIYNGKDSAREARAFNSGFHSAWCVAPVEVSIAA